jgi:pseudaminic acid biosynthesis-associated methylase
MTDPAAGRLEALWQGDFGREYTERNAGRREARARFWREVLDAAPAARVLEVGCNRGLNLEWIAPRVTGRLVGVDVNAFALGRLRAALPRVDAVAAAARALPFADASFDLVFTMGVLIHLEPATLPAVMAEIVRCSRRWVLCGEYFADAPTEVFYRGHAGALFKQDYGARYREVAPGLALHRRGHLTRAEGFDDVTWWLFEKGAAR